MNLQQLPIFDVDFDGYGRRRAVNFDRRGDGAHITGASRNSWQLKSE